MRKSPDRREQAEEGEPGQADDRPSPGGERAAPDERRRRGRCVGFPVSSVIRQFPGSDRFYMTTRGLICDSRHDIASGRTRFEIRAPPRQRLAVMARRRSFIAAPARAVNLALARYRRRMPRACLPTAHSRGRDGRRG